jgi:hypothetical protein
LSKKSIIDPFDGAKVFPVTLKVRIFLSKQSKKKCNSEAILPI